MRRYERFFINERDSAAQSLLEVTQGEWVEDNSVLTSKMDKNQLKMWVKKIQSIEDLWLRIPKISEAKKERNR